MARQAPPTCHLPRLLLLATTLVLSLSIKIQYGHAHTMQTLFVCPEKCQCSKTGASINCDGKGLTEIPSGIPKQVEKLYLDHNSFGTLKTGDLSNLTHLTQVYLRSSQVQVIQSGAFRDLPMLREIYLATNLIDQLNASAFQRVSSLTYLNLAANRLTTVPDLPSLPALNSLVLEGNRILSATFPPGYHLLTDLNSIVLSNNNFTTLTNDTFAALNNSNVGKMEISRCGIRNVSAGALTPLQGLKSLKIGNNPLDGPQLQQLLQGLSQAQNLVSLDIRAIALGGSLPSRSFSILSNTPLTTLIFKNNKVGTVPARAFADLPKLVTLDLSSCQIHNMSDDALTDLPNLQILFLSHNTDLSSVPRNLPKSLLKLYLQYNGIKTLDNGEFRNLNSLTELYLSNNQMLQIMQDSFMGLTSLRILHLQNNKLSYIPKQLFAPLPNLRNLVLKNNKLKSLKPNPGAMAKLASLVTLDLSDNQCSYIPFDFFAGLSSLQSLALDHNNLGNAVAGDTGGMLFASMGKLQRLSLAGNRLRHIHDNQFRKLLSLQVLNLKNNQLSSWGPGLFAVPGSSTKSLQTLDLSSNQIALVNETSVKDLHHLKTLNLSLNPFACTCDLRWFRSWINRTAVNVTNKNSYRCHSPTEWVGKPLLEFTADKVDCVDYTWYYVGGAIAATLVLALVIFYVIYRYRWFIWLRLYRLRKAIGRCSCCSEARRAGYTPVAGQDRQTKRFNFYVVAADKDTDWVAEKLLPKVDKGPMVGDRHRHYKGRYALFFEPRDAEPGKLEIATFDEMMPASRAVLIVLTANLARDAWCSFLIHQAYQLLIEGSIEDIKIIKVGNVSLRHIPQRLQKAMERREYLEWLETAEHLVDALGQGHLLQGQGQGQVQYENHDEDN